MDALAHYQLQAVETAGPAQLVLMLYDGALGALARAEQALGEAVDLETANRELQRVQDIVSELAVSLDTERGGQIAANLGALYDFCLDRLISANVGKDARPLAEVRNILGDLRSAWDEACCAAVAS